MFVAFIVQIVFRYFLNFPIGWTSELTVITWLWLVLWGAAFVVKESEEIRFDLVYAAAGRRTRRVMGIITGVAIVALYAVSLPATLDYVTFMKVEKTAYLKIRFDWLFSIYVIFVVAVIVRYVWILWHLLRGKAPDDAGSDQGELRPVNPTSPFSLAVMAIVGLSLLGLPIGHAMIGGSVLYLYLAGLDMGTAAEQLLNGMYTSYVLLAIPLFILAAEFMNSGSIMDRLLRFCNALVGRFRGGLAQVNVVQSIIFAGMSGSALADAAGSGKLMQTMMTQGRQVHGELRRRPDRGLLGDRPDHPAVDPDGDLRAGLRHVDRLPVPRRRHPGPADRRRRRWADRARSPGGGTSRSSSPSRCASCRASPGEAFPALMMPVILLGCLYSGVTTPTEAAAVAAAYALLVSAAALSQHRLARQSTARCSSSARITASIGMLIAGAMVFNYVVTVENIPKTLSVMLQGVRALAADASCWSRTSCC